MAMSASVDVARRSVPAAVHLLRHALDVAADVPAGRPTRDVPALASADPDRSGIAFATVDGACLGAGDWTLPFSLQSVSKVFALALLVAAERDDAWAPFATPGNEDHRSAAALDPREGVAPGPFTNAGAMVVVDRLMDHHPDVAAAVAGFVAAEALAVAEPLTATVVDEDVARGELAVAHRNRALAHLLAERGLLRHPVESVLEQYLRQCAVAATCRAVSLAGLALAREGVRRNGTSLLDRRQARRVNALMLTSGAYADSGRYAVQVGLPLKTGVGGGVLAVVPGRGALCAWSPGLDDVGTPRRALAAIAHVAEAQDLSVF